MAMDYDDDRDEEEEEEEAEWGGPGKIDIDGDSVRLVGVNVDRHGEMATIRVETEDGEEREYVIFPDSEVAGELAMQNKREDLLWGLDSGDQKKVDMAVSNILEYVGKETLVMWALGLPAGPGYAKVKSLDEWFELFKENPEEEWASYDSIEADIGPDDDDIVEMAVLADASAWYNMIDKIGFEPGVAYRRD
jgi:hypothetical protein